MPPALSPRPLRHQRAVRWVAGCVACAGVVLGGVSCDVDTSTSSTAATTHTPQATAAPTVGATIGNGYIRAPGAPFAVFAHRGAPTLAPENTLPSDEAARQGGATWIENDVQPSRDGVPHIMHDATVDRTTNGTGRITELTTDQLATLDAGARFAPGFAGTRVPTLRDQLLDLRTRGGRLLLEIKDRQSREQIARIVDEVRTSGMDDRVFVQSFDAQSLRITRELAPELPLGLLSVPGGADPIALAEELRLTSYNPSFGEFVNRPKLVARLHAVGVAVMVWTVDDPEQWATLDAAGVDGIITNRVGELVRWEAARTR
ncbi:glycerophosphodiester phosphodiesterase family protein [Streptomyces sp. SID3343]|uniref:glycerophosphodiester phosphodiesterase n=1 Tax=Streptomyces sp. SID3343 TaxID=2690260 RepID=UPI0019282D1C|nr:glycerophosphodiester phosphodiesterase family protein [Streptomyces sp. SID3343]